MECALSRRRALKADPKSHEAIHYCCSHRLVRPQFYNGPNMRAHFRLFHVCSAGRDRGNMRFETDAIFMHASAYLSVLQRIAAPDSELEFVLTDFHEQDRYEHLEKNLLQRLRDTHDGVRISINDDREAGRGYYRDLCFHVNARVPGEAPIQLGDGGSVDWTQKLLGSAKERLIISAISSERMCGLRA